MNAWDAVTWFSSIVLAVSALVIFVFFMRDAGSILNREMHGHDEEADSPSPSGTSATPPEDQPR